MPEYAEASRRPNGTNHVISTWKQWQFWKDINYLSKTLLKVQWRESETTCTQCLGRSSSLASPARPRLDVECLTTPRLFLPTCLPSSPYSPIPDICYYSSKELHPHPPPRSSSLSLGLWVTQELTCGMCQGNPPNSYTFLDRSLSQQSMINQNQLEQILISIGILSVIRQRTLGPWHLAQSPWEMQKSVSPDTKVLRVAEK